MSLELLSLGLDFMGGLMGQSNARRNFQLQQQGLQQAQRQFDAQMDQSVQRRVKDAQAAGVHPLFALGASVGASPTISANASQGDNQGNPMQSALTAMAATLGVIEQNKASAKRDEAEAQLLDSERRRIEQELSQRGQDKSVVNTYPYGTKVAPATDLGPVEPVVPQVYTHQPGKTHVESGVHPGYRELDIGDGTKIRIFADSAQADEINQFAIGGGLLKKGVKRFMHSIGWKQDKNGVWYKADEGTPWIRVRRPDGSVLFSW